MAWGEIENRKLIIAITEVEEDATSNDVIAPDNLEDDDEAESRAPPGIIIEEPVIDIIVFRKFQLFPPNFRKEEVMEDEDMIENQDFHGYEFVDDMGEIDYMTDMNMSIDELLNAHPADLDFNDDLCRKIKIHNSC